MSRNKKTRSTLSIDAVAQATATGVATALNPLRKLNHIAALAGIVLHLFRSRVPVPGRSPERPRRIQEGNKKETRGKNGPGKLPARSRPATVNDGGTRHG